ncbi:MAG: contact-dependent growth inhibition system immunity protein [Chitinophagales bacterium]
MKTIENIENNDWGNAPADASYLVRRTYELRKKEISCFTTEDLRILISQNLFLEVLIPNAMQILNTNLFAEGDFYAGDLLKSVITSDPTFWKNNPHLKREMNGILEKKLSEITEHGLTQQIIRSLLSCVEQFKKGN